MKIADQDLNNKVLIIAEIGNNHEGSVDVAKRMIEAAAHAGADAVKFQTIRAQSIVRPQDKVRFETLKSFELSYADFANLAIIAANEGVMFLSTPFDLEACDFLNDLVPAFKIASGDITFYPLIEKIATFGKPIILSTGLANLSEIDIAKALIHRIWQNRKILAELALLHCVTSYPTPPNEANLNAIQLLQNRFGGCIGYSDHTLGISAAIASVAVGARIVEKHFTLDKNYSNFQDHKLSADPKEMSELVSHVREIEVLLGSGEKGTSTLEAKNLFAARRSIAVNKELRKGHRLLWEDICWLRPNDGIAPGAEHLILGKILSQDIERGTILTEKMFD